MSLSCTAILLTAAGFLALVLGLVVDRRRARVLTGAATVLAALGGFFAYGYGFSHQISFLPLAVARSVLASLGMFLGRNDFSAVSGTPFFLSPPAQLLFWAPHILALYATASAALTTIGASAMRRLRLLLIRRGDLVVLYGTGEGALSFGKQLSQAHRCALVYVDAHSSAAGEVESMGAVLFTGPSALAGSVRFLKSIGMGPGRRQLHLYAMGDDPAQSLRFSAALLSALEQRRVHPRQTFLTLSGAEDTDAQALQALGGRYGYGSVSVFDSASLAARLLVREYPPCAALTFDASARALRDFEALVVGFGRVGQAVLRQLVMNGQFEGSRFRLAVFAPDCLQVSGALSHSSRALLDRYDLTLHPYDARSPEMYRFLEERASTLRYVVVCTGEEKRNRELAEQLHSYLLRLGSDAAVYRCSYSGVACHGPQGSVSLRQGLYTPQTLWDDAPDRMAIALNQCYCGQNGRSARENWAQCDYFSRLSSRASADFIPAFLAAAGKSAAQVLSQGWDLTPAQLESLSRTEHLRWCAFHFVMGFDTMPSSLFAQRCRRARELELRGERPSRDLARRLHACLVPWEELDALSAAENAATGRGVDYRAMDRDNVLALPRVLAAAYGPEAQEKE